MKLGTRRDETEKPLHERSEKELRSALTHARKELNEVKKSDPAALLREGRSEEMLARGRRAVDTINAASALLAEREAEARGWGSRVRRSAGGPVARALTWAARALGGDLTLKVSWLTEEQGRELVAFVDRWEQLSDNERRKVETLVGTAAGDPQVFERRRDKAKLEATLARARRELRDPRVEMITAAVLADEFILDGLRHRPREDAVGLDELGNKVKGTTGRLLELDNVAALVLLLHLLAENDGQETTLSEHGSPRNDLPMIPPVSLGQLRRNGLLTVRYEGVVGIRVGYGERTRAIAKRWGIGLPAEADPVKREVG